MLFYAGGAVSPLQIHPSICLIRSERLLRRCHAAPKRCGSELEL